MPNRAYLSIGEVLTLLKEEFPDVTISKIRFLESQGLLDPERTPSGYRKFYDTDVERLRWILRQQREHYLPLKVIKGRLGSGGGDEEGEVEGEPEAGAGASTGANPTGAGERGAAADTRAGAAVGATPADGESSERNGSRRGDGRERLTSTSSKAATPDDPGALTARRGPARTGAAAAPAPAPTTSSAMTSRVPPPSPARPSASTPPAPSTATAPDRPVPASTTAAASGGAASLTLEELGQACGLSVEELRELEKFGIIVGRPVARTVYYDDDAVAAATLAAGFLRFGVEARHLRMYKTAAEREAGFFEQVVMPMLKQRNPKAKRQAQDTLEELSRLGEQMRVAMLRQALKDFTGS